MAMQFTRVIGPIEEMEVWKASSNAASFVISYESQSGPGFHGQTGFAVSWRPIDQNRSAALRTQQALCGQAGSPAQQLRFHRPDLRSLKCVPKRPGDRNT